MKNPRAPKHGSSPIVGMLLLLMGLSAIQHPLAAQASLDSLILQAEHYFETAQYDSSLALSQKGLEQARQSKNQVAQIDLLVISAKSKVWLGDSKGGIAEIMKAIELLPHARDKKQTFTVLQMTGIAFDRDKQHHKALEFYNQALAAIKDEGLLALEAKAHNNISVSYSEMGLHDKAFEALLKNLKLYSLLGENKMLSITLNNIGFIYFNQGKYEEALAYFHKGLVSSFGLSDSLLIANYYNNLGETNHLLDRPDSALYYFEKALGVTERNNYPEIYLGTQENLSGMYLKMGEPEKAEQIYLQSIELAQSIDNDHWIKSNILLLVDLYTAQKNHDKVKEYLALHQSIDNYYASKKDSLNAILLSLTARQSAEQTKASSFPLQKYFWVAIFFFAISSIIFIYFLSQYKQHHRQAIAELNAEKTEQETETNTIDLLPVSGPQGNTVIPIHEIHFITKEGKYCCINTYDKVYRSNKTLSVLEEILPPDTFIRINRSIIINLSKMEGYSFWEFDKYIVRMADQNHSQLTMTRDRLNKNLMPVMRKSS